MDSEVSSPSPICCLSAPGSEHCLSSTQEAATSLWRCWELSGRLQPDLPAGGGGDLRVSERGGAECVPEKRRKSERLLFLAERI